MILTNARTIPSLNLRKYKEFLILNIKLYVKLVKHHFAFHKIQIEEYVIF